MESVRLFKSCQREINRVVNTDEEEYLSLENQDLLVINQIHESKIKKEKKVSFQ